MAALFSKLLTKTDVENYLCITSCSLGQKLPFEVGQTMNMHVQDNDGKEWIFACTIRTDETLVRHLVCVDWIEFARKKDVRVGDQVIIHDEFGKYQASAEGSWVKIEVQRKIRLFGVDIWANVH